MWLELFTAAEQELFTAAEQGVDFVCMTHNPEVIRKIRILYLDSVRRTYHNNDDNNNNNTYRHDSRIRLASVGLAQARPNYSKEKDSHV